MDSAAQRALAIPEILFEIYRWIMMADPLYTSSKSHLDHESSICLILIIHLGLPDSDGSWRSLCEYAALALLPYTTVNKLWLNVAMRCTQHSWQNMIATGQFLQDVLAQAPTICRQGLANSVSIATISTVSHRCAAAADAPFRGWSFPNMMMLTIVLGDHADGTRELCSMLSTRSHVPAIQCPQLTVLSIFRSGNGADLDEDPECDCGKDGVYALPEDWRALFKQITVSTVAIR